MTEYSINRNGAEANSDDTVEQRARTLSLPPTETPDLGDDAAEVNS